MQSCLRYYITLYNRQVAKSPREERGSDSPSYLIIQNSAKTPTGEPEPSRSRRGAIAIVIPVAGN